MSTEKVSAEQVFAVFAEAPEAIRKLASSRDEWKAKYEAEHEKVASYERRGVIEKMASQMIDKGMDGGATKEELMTRLEGWAAQNKLAELQMAIELNGPDMGQKIATVYDGTGTAREYVAGGDASVAANSFERAIIDE